jgi:hypothetical protein
MSAPPRPRRWRSPEELLEIGLRRSRVVMMNEAHDGLTRCVRTRRLGARLLPVAHRGGVRWFAMEALNPAFADEANETRRVPDAACGYLAQPDMRALIAAALALGWQLVAYEADFAQKPSALHHLSVEEANWREDQQARNLRAALEKIPDENRLLVWCGNHHLAKYGVGDRVPMGARLAEQGAVEPFAIDQTSTVRFGHGDPYGTPWVEAYASEIETLGGAAGFLGEEAPPAWPSPELSDAFVLAIDNDLE